jgi:hypothetical protein
MSACPASFAVSNRDFDYPHPRLFQAKCGSLVLPWKDLHFKAELFDRELIQFGIDNVDLGFERGEALLQATDPVGQLYGDFIAQFPEEATDFFERHLLRLVGLIKSTPRWNAARPALNAPAAVTGGTTFIGEYTGKGCGGDLRWLHFAQMVPAASSP